MPSSCNSTVSSVRKREDRSALSSIDKRIRIRAYDLLDAPLRFGVPPTAVCRPETVSLRQPAEIDHLAACIREYFVRGLVVAPLGLGGHVDHLAISTAAIASARPDRLGFYEDLPYATWTSESSLRSRVCQIEKELCTGLAPAVIRTDRCSIPHKLRTIRRYRSQINRSEAVAIAMHAVKYHCGERIWLPKYSKTWLEFL